MFPRVHAVTPVSGPPGSTFRIAFAGFPPESEIGLDLYQYVDANTYAYLTTLPPPVTDALGETIYELPTAAGDPDGLYCVVYRLPSEVPHTHCDASFTLTS